MELKMIKELQLASTLSPEEHKVLQAASDVLTNGSIASLLEGMAPTHDQYALWLSVIVDEAVDLGVNLNIKSKFLDLAAEVISNDPEPPDEDMVEMIVNKLWKDYQSAKQGTRIEKLVKAQENEEQLQAASDLAQSPASDMDSQHSDDIAIDDIPAGSEIEISPDECNSGGEDGDRVLSDADIDAIVKRVLAAVENNDDVSLDKEVGGDTSGLSVEHDENEEQGTKATGIMHSTTGSEVTGQTLMQRMLSGPRSSISQAQKSIEQDGETAWKTIKMPENPHPQKSIANSAWDRGFKRAAKKHFGLDETPPVSTSKHKRK